jgi:rod shape-determining protein MreC
MSRERYSYSSYGTRGQGGSRVWIARGIGGLFAIFAIVLLLMAEKPSVANLRAHLLAGVQPVMEIVSKPIGAVRAAIRSKDEFFSAIDENKRLHEENDNLRHWQAVALALKAENESLRNLSGYAPVENAKYVTARVIGQSVRAYGSTISLNAGSADGVAPHQPVIDAQGLIGRITTVTPHGSQALLLDDAMSRVPVVTGNSRQRAILVGTGEELLRLNFFAGDPRDIALGEPVVTTEEGDLIPGGILIGTVFSRGEQGLLVKPSRPIAQAEYVRVVVAK